MKFGLCAVQPRCLLRRIHLSPGDGLAEKVIHACRQTYCLVLTENSGVQCDVRRMPAAGLLHAVHFPGHVEAVHLRHVHIHKHQARLILLIQPQRLKTVMNFERLGSRQDRAYHGSAQHPCLLRCCQRSGYCPSSPRASWDFCQATRFWMRGSSWGLEAKRSS